MALVPFSKLVEIPLQFYKTIGQLLLEPTVEERAWLRSLKVLFVLSITNYNILWILQVAYFFKAVRESDTMVALAIAPCFGFGFMANFKQTTLVLNKLEFRRILSELETMYPLTIDQQKTYRVESYLRTLKLLMITFAGLCLFNTFCFTLYPLVESMVAVIFQGAKFNFPLGFLMLYPYDPIANWFNYILTYGMQIIAAYFAGVSFLVVDLLLVSSVTQLCMHFEFISKSLRMYQLSDSKEENNRFLKGVLRYHIKCLELTKSIDVMFRLSLLLNFLIASGTICFVGFQMVAGSTEDVLRFSVLMATSLAQVWIICTNGNKLIDASQGIGDAAFGHPWYQCDLAYRKMIGLIICRSQKAAAIHAPTFPPISLQTFMKVISMAYQFFAVLRTINEKQ